MQATLHGPVVRAVVLVIQTHLPKQGVEQQVAAAQLVLPDQCLSHSMPQAVAVAEVVVMPLVRVMLVVTVLHQGAAVVAVAVA